jgi:hypothetical protein
VYWRRRAVVVGAAIVLIVVIVMIIRAAGSGGDGKTAATPITTVGSLTTSPPATELPPDCTRTDLEVGAEAVASYFENPAKPTFSVSVTNTGTVKCVIDPEAVNIVITSGTDPVFDSDDNCGDAGTGPAENDAGDSTGAAGPEELSDAELLSELDAPPAVGAGNEAGTTPVATETGGVAGDPLIEPLTGSTGSTMGTQVLLEPGVAQQIPVTWDRERSAPECEPYLLTTPLPGTYHAVFTVAGVESNDVVFDLR